jgi:hypothetical protein
MFRWALSQDNVEADPTAGLKGYDPGTPRDRVLTVEEIETLWKWLDSDSVPADVADMLRLELLTGARCGEISGLRAEEIDRHKWIWTLPQARSKNGRQRITPIVGTAREILERRLPDIDKGQLFVTGTGSVMTSAHIGHYLLTRRARLPIDMFTTHDLRRTFATMLAEMGVALDLVAAIVGHESGGKDTPTWSATTCGPICSSERRMRSRRGTSGSKRSWRARGPRRWYGCLESVDARLAYIELRCAGETNRIVNVCGTGRLSRSRPLTIVLDRRCVGSFVGSCYSSDHAQRWGRGDGRSAFREVVRFP